MMDLGNNSLCEECGMICTDIYSDEEYEEMVVYRDQGISSRKYDKDTYGELMNTDSEEEKPLIIMGPYAHKTVCHWRKNKDS